MPTITAAEALLRAHDAPVPFLDTCVLLDVIRATHRCLDGAVRSAVEHHGMLAADPPTCALVVASMVPKEWSDNAPKITDEVQVHLQKIEEQAGHFHDACQLLGIGLPFGRPAYCGAGLAQRLRDLSEHLLNLAIRLEADTPCAMRGLGRVIAKCPPSERSGEVKDSVIVEECVELTRQLRANGFTRKCVFCTSSTKDYGGQGVTPHPKLDLDFKAVDLRFASNLPFGVHDVMT